MLFSSSDSRHLIVSCCSKGNLIVWERSSISGSVPVYEMRCCKLHENLSLTVTDAIQVSEMTYVVGCLTTDSRVLIYMLENGE